MSSEPESESNSGSRSQSQSQSQSEAEGEGEGETDTIDPERIVGYEQAPIPKPIVKEVASELAASLDDNYGDTLHTTAKRFRNSRMPPDYTPYTVSSALIALTKDADEIASSHGVTITIWNEDANRPAYVVKRLTDDDGDDDGDTSGGESQ